MKLVLQEKLRPDALSGVPVVLSDGQAWTIPKPRVRFTPDDGEMGYRASLSVSQVDGYQGLLDARDQAIELLGKIEQADDEGVELDDLPPGHPLIRAELAIFKALLLRNYHLSAAEVADVLAVGYAPDEDPEGYELRSLLLEVAMGNSPKPVGVTSDSPSS